METQRRHDVVVIGGGSAGDAATRTTCETGADVAIYYHGAAADLFRMPHDHPTLGEIVTYPAESIVGQMRGR